MGVQTAPRTTIPTVYRYTGNLQKDESDHTQETNTSSELQGWSRRQSNTYCKLVRLYHRTKLAINGKRFASFNATNVDHSNSNAYVSYIPHPHCICR